MRESSELEMVGMKGNLQWSELIIKGIKVLSIGKNRRRRNTILKHYERECIFTIFRLQRTETDIFIG